MKEVMNRQNFENDRNPRNNSSKLMPRGDSSEGETQEYRR